MAASSFSVQIKAYSVPMHLNSSPSGSNLSFPKDLICPTKRVSHQQVKRCRAFCSLEVSVPSIDIPLSASTNSTELIVLEFFKEENRKEKNRKELRGKEKKRMEFFPSTSLPFPP
ncbi:hypothetical protein R6Q57_012745 [Mikania cordata]